MEPLHALFPDIAERDRYTVTVTKRPGLPTGRYTFLEAHCTDIDCDCRMVMVGVFSEEEKEHLATVEYRLPHQSRGKKKKEATAALAEGAPQSPSAPAMLILFEESLRESDYGQKLESHYQLIRQSLQEPEHPIHTTLRNLRQWVGARWPVPAYITGEGAPYRPDIILWLDNRSGMILAQNLVGPDAPDEAMVDVLQKALALTGKENAPAVLRVAQEGQARALRDAFGEEFTVEVGPIPEIDPVRQSLEETFSGATTEQEQSYLQEGRVKPESMARLFRAAAHLHQVAPWEVLYDTDCLSLSVPALGVKNAVISVMGKAGQSFGFLVFPSAEDAETFFKFANASAEGEASPQEDIPGVGFFSLELVPGSEIPSKVRREISRYRWEVASPQAYPEIRCIDPDLSSRPFGEDEVALFTAAAEALCEFVSRHKEALARKEEFSAEEEYKSHYLPRKPVLKVVWPYPWSAASEEEEEDLIPPQAAALRDAFLESLQKTKEHDEIWFSTAGDIITALYYFKLHEKNEPLETWKATSLKAYLLEYVPNQFDLQKEEIGWVPEILESFFAWLSQEKHLSAASARSLTQKIAELRDEYTSAMHDPSRFGLVKRLFQMARAEGGPPSPEALARFIAQSSEEDAAEFAALLGSLFFEEEEKEEPVKTPKKATSRKTTKKKTTKKKK